uniref:Uncharacterized protein n=1 Tax=Vitis vinifera TaxID=29760 RepID=F6HLG2_VITVI
MTNGLIILVNKRWCDEFPKLPFKKKTWALHALYENKIQHHQQAHFRLQHRCVYSLGSSHHLGVRVESLSEEIVHHEHHAEHHRQLVGHGGLNNSHSGGFRAIDDVVEVEVEVVELLFLEAHRYGIKISGETVGILTGVGGRGGRGGCNGGEEDSEKDERFHHGGEELNRCGKKNCVYLLNHTFL